MHATNHPPRSGKKNSRQYVQRLETRLLLSMQPFADVQVMPGAVASASVMTRAAATVSFSGAASWTDSAGGTHAVPLATVEIRSSAQADAAPPLATVQTDISGNFSGSFMFDTAGGPITVFARIFARNPGGDVKPDTGAAAKTYFMDSAGQAVAGAGTVMFPTRVGSNAVVAEEAFSIVAAVLEASTYAARQAIPLAIMPSQLDVRYPSNTATRGSASHFRPDTKQLFITQRRVFDWDVIQHEFGHYFMDRYAISAVAGGSHSSGVSNPKPKGPGLAWNEGYATYFAISAQRDSGNPAYAAGVPQVGDTAYNPKGPPVDTNPFLDLAADTGVGETDELSVGSALYHLSVGDQGIKISAKTLFNTAINAKATTFGAEYDALAATRSGQDRSLMGHVLGLQHIAPVETAPADAAANTGAIPTFTWDANGSNDFIIQFYSSDFKTLIDQTAGLGNVTTFTPDATEWSKIFNGHSTVKWVVEGKDTTNPATPGAVPDQVYAGQTLDRYWSSAGTLSGPSIALVIDNTGSMSPEIGAVQASLVQYISNLQAALAPGETAPTIELITFVDAPREVISSNDLDAVKAAVNAMTASGGGDCPEPSAVSLQYAGQQIGAGGTIMLVTDASSDAGSDLSGTIGALRAKGVTVNAIISGNCSLSVEPMGLGSPATPAVSPIIRTAPGAAATDSVSTNAAAPAPVVTRGFPTADGPEPDQGTITDPGQMPVADHGSTPATATRLTVDGPIVGGAVGNMVQDATGSAVANLNDDFVFHLIAGTAYNIPVTTDSNTYVAATLLDTDGATVLQSVTTSVGDTQVGAATLSYTPTVTGDYYLKVGQSGGVAAFAVQVSDNPIVGTSSSVILYSTASAATGGEFLYKDAIASSSDPAVTTDYQAALLNVMDSTFRPTVLSAAPNALPQGTILEVTLTGRKTNWQQGFSTVSFSNSSIHVNSVVVNSPTSLTATVSIDASGTIGFSDATVMTLLGAATETATGANAVQVSAAPTGPTLLQVQPGSLARGDTRTIIVLGTGTAWDSTSTLSLGPGITVTSVSVNSPTKITAQIQVGAGADIGFRMAAVNTSSGASDVQDRAIMVSSSAISSIPIINSVTPSQAGLGQHVDISVVASNTHFAAGATTAALGTGVTVSSVTVTDATHAVIHADVAAGAPASFRNVTLTTGSESAALLNGFLVSSTGSKPVVSGPPAQTVFAGANQAINLGSFAGGAGPWSIDVNWGDGSADTVFTAASAGVIPAQAHTFASAGSPTVTVTVTNTAAATDNATSASGTVSVVNNTALLVTDPSKPSLSVAGSGVLDATGSGLVFVNSGSRTAIGTSGHATASANTFNIVGKVKKGSHLLGIVNIGQPPAANPLSALAAPAAPAQVFKAVRYSKSAPLTLQPGTYAGGIKIGGRASVTLAPGLYFLAGGGFSIAGRTSVIGTGVMIYLSGGKPGAIKINGSANLTPMTSGTYKGIVFYQDPADHAAATITGSLVMSGIFYAPGTQLMVNGRGSLTDSAAPADVIDALAIFSDVKISGGGNVTIDSAQNTIAGLLGLQG